MFTQKTTKTGAIQYRSNGKMVSKDNLSEEAKAALANNPEGTVVDEAGAVVPQEGNSKDNNTNSDTDTDEPGDGPEDAPDSDDSGDDEEEAPAPARQSASLASPGPLSPGNTPQSEPGMGFPRKGGVTVDIFDGKTPHTHVRNVNGLMVPLNEENFRTKTDSEVYAQLKKLDLAV